MLLFPLFASCSNNDPAKLKVYNYTENNGLDSRSIAKLQAEIIDADIPVFSVSIIRQGKLISTYLLGCDSLDLYSDKTLFQAGSISKLMTSCLVLKLHDRLTKPLPMDSFMRSLLSHTAGYDVDGFLGYTTKAPSNEQIIRGEGTNIFNPQPQKVRPINERFFYSGGGYSIVQHLVEHHEGKDFNQIASYTLFDSLDMPFSTFELTPKSHFVEGSVWGFEFNHWQLPQSAAAGLWTNTSEYAKFLIEIFESYQRKSTFYSPSAIQRLLRPTKTLDGEINPYSLGCYVENQTIYHGGRTLGYTSFFEMSLNTGDGYVFIGNSHDINKDDILSVLKQKINL